MSRRLPSHSLLVFLLLSAACRTAAGPDEVPLIGGLPRALTPTEQALAAASNAFGFALLRETNASFADSNLVIAPLSAMMALGMALQGAESTTFTEMRSAMALGSWERDEIAAAARSLVDLLTAVDPRVRIRIANALFYRESFGAALEREYLQNLQRWFSAEAMGLDFAAPQAPNAINDWARRKTDGLVPRIVDRLPPNLVLILLNAVYFKGEWRTAFDRQATRPLPFRTASGAEVPVATMSGRMRIRAGTLGDGTQVGELPYGGDAYVMTIVLPPPGQALRDYAASIDTARWNTLLATLVQGEYVVQLPKLSLAWEDSLNDELRAMGMRQAFRPGEADFTRMSRIAGRELYIDLVKQKSFVAVDESGTTAAAVTSVGIGIVSMPTTFEVNRPFLFAIRERHSGTILFLGKVADPSSG